MADSGLLTVGTKTTLFEANSSKLVGRIGVQLNASKRNIFEDEGSWGLNMKYKTWTD